MYVIRSGSGDGDSFAEATERIYNENDVCCVILIGAGEAFLAGRGLNRIRDREGCIGAAPLVMREEAYRKNLHRVFRKARAEIPRSLEPILRQRLLRPSVRAQPGLS